MKLFYGISFIESYSTILSIYKKDRTSNTYAKSISYDKIFYRCFFNLSIMSEECISINVKLPIDK